MRVRQFQRLGTAIARISACPKAFQAATMWSSCATGLLRHSIRTLNAHRAWWQDRSRFMIKVKLGSRWKFSSREGSAGVCCRVCTAHDELAGRCNVWLECQRGGRPIAREVRDRAVRRGSDAPLQWRHPISNVTPHLPARSMLTWRRHQAAPLIERQVTAKRRGLQVQTPALVSEAQQRQ